jgi:hypothetical protein
MGEIADMSTRFEAVKIAMTQDKNGFVLKLSLHPNDTPEDIMRDPVGTRYMMVAVRMDDEGQPSPSADQQEGVQAVRIAGALCGDTRFQQWLALTGATDEISETAAADAVRKYCVITSRAELKTDKQAREKLAGLRAEFMEYLRRR